MKRKLIPRKKRRKASGKKPSHKFRLRVLQRPEIILILEKLVTITHPSSDQRRLSYGRLKRIIKIDGYEMNKPLSGLLLCRLIISLAERLCSKFHSFSRGLASRPNVHLRTISQPRSLSGDIPVARRGLFNNYFMSARGYEMVKSQ